jgi:hypothetical protein
MNAIDTLASGPIPGGQQHIGVILLALIVVGTLGFGAMRLSGRRRARGPGPAAGLLKATEKLSKNITRNGHLIADLNAQIQQSQIQNERVLRFAEKFTEPRVQGFTDYSPEGFELRAKNVVSRTMKANGHNPAFDYGPPSWSDNKESL